MLNDVANFTRKRSRKLVETCADLQGRDNMYALSKIIPNMLDTDLQVCGWWGGAYMRGEGTHTLHLLECCNPPYLR